MYVMLRPLRLLNKRKKESYSPELLELYVNFLSLSLSFGLKGVTNENGGGSGRRQMFGIGLGPL
jgi:hypothetical protein